MRVGVVTGSRHHSIPREKLAETIGKIDLLIVGDALGADLSAYAYARDVLGLSIEAGTIRVHYASDHGKWPACGPKRNTAIADDAASELAKGHEVVAVAFPAPDSSGTWDCVRKLRRQSIAAAIHRVGAPGSITTATRER